MRVTAMAHAPVLDALLALLPGFPCFTPGVFAVMVRLVAVVACFAPGHQITRLYGSMIVSHCKCRSETPWPPAVCEPVMF